jgi:hypothetical protein
MTSPFSHRRPKLTFFKSPSNLLCTSRQTCFQDKYRDKKNKMNSFLLTYLQWSSFLLLYCTFSRLHLNIGRYSKFDRSYSILSKCFWPYSVYLWLYSPFVGPWPLFSFLILRQSVGPLGRVSARRKAVTYTQNSAYRHPCLKRDSNSRSRVRANEDSSWLRPRGSEPY